MAGLRAVTVGTDTTSYALPLFELASSSGSFTEFYSSSWYRLWYYSDVSSFEIGYLAIVWLSSKLESFQLQLFLTSLLTVGPFYLAFTIKRNELSMPLCMTLFLLVFYNTTLNGMRQWIAVAFIFLALFGVYQQNLLLRQQKKVIILLLIAILFHLSAILGFLILIVRLYLSGGNLIGRYCALLVGCLVLLVFLELLRNAIILIGLDRYVNYLGVGTIQIVWSSLILQAPFLVWAVYLYRSRLIDERLSVFLLSMMTLSVLLGQLASLGTHSARIAIYFDVFEVPLMGIIQKTICNRDKVKGGESLESISITRILCSAFTVAYGLCYWIFFYYVSGSGETIPYLFFWQ